jgi:hypothetical protein
MARSFIQQKPYRLMLNENELKMLELIVANKGDVELAKQDYANILRGQFVEKAGGLNAPLDSDLLKVINTTVDNKVKAILPEIGTGFIKHGKILGGRLREGKISSNNHKENE